MDKTGKEEGGSMDNDHGLTVSCHELLGILHKGLEASQTTP